jgi:acyl-CoA synthetase (AMP-forming)/AMP-acid ligase II
MMRASRLRWEGASSLPPAAREALLGHGAPFELRTEPVLGPPVEVFARRPPNLLALLRDGVARHGEREHLVFDDERLTWTEVGELVEGFARVLAEDHGVGRGDRVAFAAANELGYVLGIWATLRLGAIVTGLNGWWTADELEHGIRLSEPRVVLADAARLDRLASIGGDVPRHHLGDVLTRARRAKARLEPVEIDEDAPAVILFTSGTTGRPKGATLSHRNFLHFPQVSMLGGAAGAALAGTTVPPPAPVSISGGPLFHVSGLLGVLSAPWTGATLVFPAPGRWDPRRHLELTEEHRVTQWSGVPTMLWRLLEEPSFAERDLSSLRTIGAGGANFPPELVRELTDALPGVTLANGYGSSETSGLGVGIAGPAFVAQPDVVGTAQPTVEAELRGPDGAPMPDGDVGEICLRHASVFLGYWGDDAATSAVLDGERWYRTGDFGRIVGGMLRLESRMRDLIIRGGENVYPIEVENRLLEHPDVAEAAVVGLPDRLLGQVVAAAVVLRPGATVPTDELRRWVGAGLASFKVPAVVVVRDELPMTETGKVQKHLLERELAELPG